MNSLKRLHPTHLVLLTTLAATACFAPGQNPAATDTDAGGSAGDSSGAAPTSEGGAEGTAGTAPTSGSPTTGDTDASTTDATMGADDSGSTTGDVSGDDTSSGGGDESSSTGEPITCGDGGVCIAAIPEGWNGPVATRTIGIEEDIPPCGGEAYTDLQVSDAFGGLQAGDYDCDCDCNPASLGCGGEAQLQLSDYPPMPGFSPCTSPNYVYDEAIVSGAPQAVSIPMDDVRGVVLADDPSSNITGSCAPEATVQPTPAGFETRTIACRTFDAVAEGCGDGLCVPQPAAPYDAPVCIWAEGDLECPAGFGDRTVYHSEYSDTRDCSTCTCGGPSGSCADASIRIRGWCDVNGSICFGPTCGPGGTFPCEEEFQGTIADFSVCEPLGAADFCTPLCDEGEICLSCTVNHTLEELRDLTYEAGTPDATCAPSGGTPTGGVSGASPTTLCCSG